MSGGEDMRWVRLGWRRRPDLEDIAERAAALRDLCREHGDVEHAEEFAQLAANAEVELAFLNENSPS
jgi:hypothetical protein